MLHILLMILKILGIILLSLIGIALLAVLTVLFVPVRYRINASKEDTIYAKAKITWLCHAVSIVAEYQEKLLCKIKICGIPIYDLSKREEKSQKAAAKSRKKAGQRKAEKKKKNVEAKRQSNKIEKQNVRADMIHGTLIEEPLEDSTSVNSPNDDKQSPDRSTQKTSLQSEAKSETQSTGSDTENVPASLWQKIKLFFQKLKALLRKILHFFQNIGYTFKRLCDKIKNIVNQLSYYKEILERDETALAFQACRKQLGRLFRHLKPSKVRARVHVGMSDPAATGQILSVCGMLYPLLGNSVQIVPNFEQEILEGNVFIKGRITVFVLLRTAWLLYFDKNIRQLIRLLKKEEKENG